MSLPPPSPSPSPAPENVFVTCNTTGVVKSLTQLADESLKIRRITVLGAGSFGTAAAMLLSRKYLEIIIYARDSSLVSDINKFHKNTKYMKDILLPENVKATDDLQMAVAKSELIIHAIPCQASLGFLKNLKKVLPAGIPIISLSKGIHAEELIFMCDIFKLALGDSNPTAYLSGPSFARELTENEPTGLVIASSDVHLAHKLQYLFASDTCRCYASNDVIGVEIGGAMKNVYALAAGIASGMGYKMNTWALIVTRGLSETRKLASAMGASEKTLAGLTGVGDLVLTCAGQTSRNRRVGVALGQGRKLNEILQEIGEVAEGVPTASACVKLAKKYNITLPLAAAVAAIINDEIDCKLAFKTLMQTPLSLED